MEGRRRFIVKGAALVAAGAATQVINAPNVIAQPKFQWRMSTTWTPALDVLQGGAQRLSKIVEEMSNARLRQPDLRARRPARHPSRSPGSANRPW